MGKKHPMSLVGHDGTQSWCEREQICEQKKCKFCANRMVNSVPTGWNGKSGVPPKAICLFQKNFHMIRVFHLHFNQLNQKFWLNGKRPRITSSTQLTIIISKLLLHCHMKYPRKMGLLLK